VSQPPYIEYPAEDQAQSLRRIADALEEIVELLKSLLAYWLTRRTERKTNPYDQDIDEAMR
jgi:hypothetical protein